MLGKTGALHKILVNLRHGKEKFRTLLEQQNMPFISRKEGILLDFFEGTGDFSTINGKLAPKSLENKRIY